MKKPRPSPAGPRKSLYAIFSARETSLNHPLKVDSKMSDAHTMVVRSNSRITILLKCRMLFATPGTNRKGCALAGLRIFVNSIAYRAWLQGQPSGAKRRHSNISRLNGSCLCAISQIAEAPLFCARAHGSGISETSPTSGLKATALPVSGRFAEVVIRSNVLSPGFPKPHTAGSWFWGQYRQTARRLLGRLDPRFDIGRIRP
jgi:hypothetical protein